MSVNITRLRPTLQEELEGSAYSRGKKLLEENTYGKGTLHGGVFLIFTSIASISLFGYWNEIDANGVQGDILFWVAVNVVTLITGIANLVWLVKNERNRSEGYRLVADGEIEAQGRIAVEAMVQYQITEMDTRTIPLTAGEVKETFVQKNGQSILVKLGFPSAQSPLSITRVGEEL